MGKWFNIRSEYKDGENPQLLIEGTIGYWPVMADDFRFRLNELPEDITLDVHIDSMGGDPFTAIQIYSMLTKRAGDVNVFIEAYCLSAASLIACAGDTVVIDSVTGKGMIHEPESETIGWMREDDHRSIADMMKAVKSQMVTIYMEKSGQSEQTIRNWMAETKWFTPEEFVEAGFADRAERLEKVTDAENDIDLAACYKNVPTKLTNQGRKSSPEEPNQQSKTRSTMNKWMLKLRNAFGLGDDSDEADVYLSAKQNKADADKLRAEKSDLEEEVESLTEERDSLKEKLDKYEADEEEAEETEFENELEAAVKNFKIKAGDKPKLKAEFEGDLPGLKKTLAHIPKNAVKASGGGKVEKPSKTKIGARRTVASGSKIKSRTDELFDTRD